MSSFSLADWPVDEDMEEAEDEMVDTSTPLHDQAAVPQAEALTTRATLTQAGKPSEGARPELVQRLAAWLGHSARSSVSSGKLNNGVDFASQRSSEEERPGVLFYNAPDSARPKVGEERFIVEQLLDQLGPIAAWAPEQVDADAGDLGQRRLSDNILTYCSRSELN